MHQVKMIRKHILAGIICTDIDPALPGAYDQVDQAIIDNGILSGTSAGWVTVRPNEQEENQHPMKCEDKEGFWHYVVWC